MTDTERRWSLRCAAMRQSFTEVRSTCGNRGSIELNWAWLAPRITHLSVHVCFLG